MKRIEATLLRAGMQHDGITEIPKRELEDIDLDKVKSWKIGRDFDTDEIVGEVTTIEVNENEILIEAEIDQYEITPSVVFTPICSKCGRIFHECDHWFDEAHVIAKDIKLCSVGFIPKRVDRE
jgi:hypothetical protein